MPPPRTCNCGKASCFTCHRRIVNERYRAAHPIDDPQPRHANRKADGTFAPEPRRAMCKAGLHPMHEGNVYFTPEGLRECRSCKIYRESQRRAATRRANKAAQEVSDAELDRRALVMMGRIQDAQ